MDIRGLSVSFGPKVIYDGFSVSFREGAVTAVLGQSGCGKTTLLNSIAFGGCIDVECSYIFQEPRLLPWCTAERNIMIVLRGSGDERLRRAREYLARVGLEGRGGEFPDRLSGGERQRVAIARAFSFPAPVLLMDEPFQSQDPAQKAQLIDLVRLLQETERRTVIAVTHDVREASQLAERAIVLGGRPVSVVLDLPVTDTPDFEKRVSEALSCQTPIAL